MDRLQIKQPAAVTTIQHFDMLNSLSRQWNYGEPPQLLGAEFESQPREATKAKAIEPQSLQ